MSDASHSRTTPDPEFAGRVASHQLTADFQRWVGTHRLSEAWLPSYYHPKYDAIGTALADPSQRWVRLGDMVEVFAPPAKSPAGVTVTWLVKTTGTALRVSEIEPHTPSVGTVLLPDRAIMLQFLATGSLAVEYWDASLYPGGGAAPEDLLILTSSTPADPGWIAWELRTNETFALQLDRARVGTPRIDRSVLLNLRVPLRGLDEQSNYGSTIRGIIRENRSLTRAQTIIEAARRRQRGFVVTAPTLQDRLRQFEDYLLREQWVVPISVFSLDTVEGSQKFAVRPIRRLPKVPQSLPGVATEITVSQEWLDWCRSSADPWRVYNSLLDRHDLPSGILANIAANTTPNIVPHNLRLSVLPSFDVWRQVYRSIWDLQGGLNPSDWSQMLEPWLPLLGGQATDDSRKMTAEDGQQADEKAETPESSLIAIVREISRPVLALKAIHEGEVARIYLIVGPDQTDDPLRATAFLEGYASILSENLNRATHFTAEAAQKESMRRLSWLRHHLNGPLGIASNALDDIRLFLRDRPEVGDELVPNPEIANKMAARPGRNLSDYALRTRLSIIEREIKHLKGFSDRIGQLSEIGANEPMSQVDVAKLLRDRAERCKDLVPGLVLNSDACIEPVIVVGNDRLLTGAFDEVLFNACRELKGRLATDPCLILEAATDQRIAVITVQDNGLPITDHLPNDPFREGVSKYRGAGGGTGLGLAIVREVLAVHGGHCLIEENCSRNGTRLNGATFTMVLPLKGGFEA